VNSLQGFHPQSFNNCTILLLLWVAVNNIKANGFNRFATSNGSTMCGTV